MTLKKVFLVGSLPKINRVHLAITCLLLVLAAVKAPSMVSAADLNKEEQQKLSQVNQAVVAAGKHYAAGKYDEAGAQIQDAWKTIRDASDEASPELQQAMMPAVKRIRKAHAMLSMEGIALPPVTLPKDFGSTKAKPSVDSAAAKKPDPKPAVEPAAPPMETTEMNADASLSFTKSIAPILANRCGKCHIAGSKGGFAMKSYAELMAGPDAGVVIFPGDAIGSRLIETIETGDMPRGGGKVSAQELKLLQDWVKAGAKFDGTDPQAPLNGQAATAAGKPAASVTTAPMTTAKMGSGSVSFAKDVAGLLVKNCNGCHVDAMQVRGGLRMNNFAQILRGGDSGAIVQAGQGSESLLVKRLRGMEGDRMPGGGRPPLTEEQIQLIAKWIDEGAMLDGSSDRQPLGTMHKLAVASSSTPEEMTAKRADLAAEAMKLSLAGNKPTQSKATEHFQVIGPVSQPTIDLVAQIAEEQIKPAKSLVSGESGEALFAGKATIFVFAKRYDYSEFAKMTEGRSLPSGWTSHWSFDGIHAYVAVVASERDDAERIESRLISPIHSVAVATQSGDVPRWFAEGVGVAVTNNRKKMTRDERNEQLFELRTAVGQTKNAKQFLDGKLPPEVSDRVGSAVAASLIAKNQRKKFNAMMREIKGEAGFDQAFSLHFGASPAAYIERWLAYTKQL